MKIISRSGWTSSIIKAPGISVADWNKIKEEVSEALKDFEKDGYEIQSLRWVNEINEITPCNVDRELAFIRILARKETGE